jgi:hypothetical protein
MHVDSYISDTRSQYSGKCLYACIFLIEDDLDPWININGNFYYDMNEGWTLMQMIN